MQKSGDLLRPLGYLAIAASILFALSTSIQATSWNVFNIEGESALSAQIVTYGTLTDMLADTNRTGVFTPNPLGFGVNIVDSGATLKGSKPVPEPATLLLLGAGLLGLVGLRRKFKE